MLETLQCDRRRHCQFASKIDDFLFWIFGVVPVDIDPQAAKSMQLETETAIQFFEASSQIQPRSNDRWFTDFPTEDLRRHKV